MLIELASLHPIHEFFYCCPVGLKSSIVWALTPQTGLIEVSPQPTETSLKMPELAFFGECEKTVVFTWITLRFQKGVWEVNFGLPRVVLQMFVSVKILKWKPKPFCKEALAVIASCLSLTVFIHFIFLTWFYTCAKRVMTHMKLWTLYSDSGVMQWQANDDVSTSPLLYSTCCLAIKMQ